MWIFKKLLTDFVIRAWHFIIIIFILPSIFIQDLSRVWMVAYHQYKVINQPLAFSQLKAVVYLWDRQLFDLNLWSVTLLSLHPSPMADIFCQKWGPWPNCPKYATELRLVSTMRSEMLLRNNHRNKNIESHSLDTLKPYSWVLWNYRAQTLLMTCHKTVIQVSGVQPYRSSKIKLADVRIEATVCQILGSHVLHGSRHTVEFRVFRLLTRVLTCIAADRVVFLSFFIWILSRELIEMKKFQHLN